MPGIFDDERRGSGPMAPDPGGTGRFFARAASRAAHGDPTPPRHPLLTLRVHLAIYWQAARLWAKRIPFHTHPKKRAALRDAPTS